MAAEEHTPSSLEERIFRILGQRDSEAARELARLLREEPGSNELARRLLETLPTPKPRDRAPGEATLEMRQATVLQQSLALSAGGSPVDAGATADADGDDGPGRIGDYQIVRRLGAGGMGLVYEAEELTSGQRVALKVMRPDLVQEESAVLRFQREGRLASSISHPRCVFVRSADYHRGQPWVAMELMPGSTLADAVRERGPLPIADAIASILDVVDGLIAAHDRGVVHRDVKPSNCFLEANGRVKVGDFGLSKSVDRDVERTQAGFVGTPLFAAPEQLRGEPADARSDQYSVAVTLYYLLTGTTPFTGKSYEDLVAAVFGEDPTPLPTHRDDLPRDLALALHTALQREPAKRFTGLRALRDALLPFWSAGMEKAPLRLRTSAVLIDLSLVLPVLFTVHQLGVVRLTAPVSLIVLLVYWWITETWCAGSLGKQALGLCVRHGIDRPGAGRNAVRVLLVGSLVLAPLFWASVVALPWSPWLMATIGAAILVGPGWLRDARLLLHDRLTGTRVVRTRSEEESEPHALIAERLPVLDEPVGAAQMIGPFRVREALSRTGSGAVALLAEDPVLERPAVLTTNGGASIPATRRELARPGRLRWLAAGQHGSTIWDAWALPESRSFTGFYGSCPGWRRIERLLRSLVAELTAAIADGSLPRVLAPEAVRVLPSGNALLLDFVPGAVEINPILRDPDPTVRAHALLRRVARALLLARQASTTREALKAARRTLIPLPYHATCFILDLAGSKKKETIRFRMHRFEDVAPELARLRRRPPTITPGMRVAPALLFFLAAPVAMLSSRAGEGRDLLQSLATHTELHGVYREIRGLITDRDRAADFAAEVAPAHPILTVKPPVEDSAAAAMSYGLTAVENPLSKQDGRHHFAIERQDIERLLRQPGLLAEVERRIEVCRRATTRWWTSLIVPDRHRAMTAAAPAAGADPDVLLALILLGNERIAREIARPARGDTLSQTAPGIIDPWIPLWSEDLASGVARFDLRTDAAHAGPTLPALRKYFEPRPRDGSGNWCGMILWSLFLISLIGRVFGLIVVTPDGRPAGFWKHLQRVLYAAVPCSLVWSMVAFASIPQAVFDEVSAVILTCLILFTVHLIGLVRRPWQAFHDNAAGTFVVPR